MTYQITSNRIPRHIPPEDNSHAANVARLDHFGTMVSLNPGGFRTPSTRKNRLRPETRIERLARYVQKRSPVER